MTELTVLQRVIALFIAVSVLGFITLLLKQCDFMWYGLRRECAVHETDHKKTESLECPPLHELALNEMDLKTMAAETMKVAIDSMQCQTQPVVVEMEMDTDPLPVAAPKTKRRRRRRRKRRQKAQE